MTLQRKQSGFGRVVPKILLSVLAACSTGSETHAQVVNLQGGASSLFNISGGGVEIRSRSYTLGLGIGYRDGSFRVGTFGRRNVAGYTVTVGDDSLEFKLPTDYFGAGQFALVRGVSVDGQVRGARLMCFGGLTARGFATPFFRGSDVDEPVGALYINRPISPSLRLSLHSVFASKQTSLASLEWRGAEWLRTAVTGGIGANRGYAAAALSIERSGLNIKAAYVGQARAFQRLSNPDGLSAEANRENVAVVWRPANSWTISATHQHTLQVAENSAPIRATVNQLGAAFTVREIRSAVSLFSSSVFGRRSFGVAAFASRDLWSRVHAAVHWSQSRSERTPHTSAVTASLRETLSTRLDLVQNITRSQGNTSIGLGGNFLSNRMSIGIDHRLVYVPLPPQPGFRQALTLSLRLRPFGNVQISGSSYVAANGKTQYSLWGSDTRYRMQAAGVGSFSSQIDLGRYIIRGRVTDAEGNAVRGAALRIGTQIVYTDANGDFFVRLKKSGTYDVAVLPEEFLAPGAWEPLFVPTPAKALPEPEAPHLEVVVQRQRLSQTRPQKQTTPASTVARF